MTKKQKLKNKEKLKEKKRLKKNLINKFMKNNIKKIKVKEKKMHFMKTKFTNVNCLIKKKKKKQIE